MIHTAIVTEVWRGNVLEVDAAWTYSGRSGQAIQIHGLTTAALDTPQGRLAHCRLRMLVLGACVQLGRVYGVTPEGFLLCDVYHHGLPIPQHLPCYAPVPPEAGKEKPANPVNV